MPTEPKEIPYPRYVALLPQYPAYRSLRGLVGMQDNLVNLSELAMRFFERDLATQPDVRSFVDSTAVELGVNTSLGAPWSQVRLNANRFSLAQAYAVFDFFCRRLGAEFRKFHRIEKWISQDGRDQMDSLTALTANMSAASQKRARACPEYELLHYYREVRNRVLHATDADTDATRARLVAEHKEHLIRAYQHVPGSFDTLDYTDYTIITRAMKYYAAVLNDCCELTVPLIMDFLLVNKNFIAEARRRKGNQEKVRRLVVIVQNTYMLGPDASDEVRPRLDNFLNDDPPHKVRRRKAQDR